MAGDRTSGVMEKYLVSIFFVVSAATAGSALGQVADVALVNMVSGDVTYAPRAESVGKVRPFTKLREGDRINVPADTQVRVVFFDGARQELWAGPANFRVGKTATEPISGKVAAATNLPVDVPQRMARIPALIQYSKLGGTQVRGVNRQQRATSEPPTNIAQARASYERLRTEMPPDDIVPELYFYAALYEVLAYDEMKVIVEEMRRKQPDNPDVKALNTWLTSQTSR